MDVHRAGPKSEGSDGQSSSRSSVSSPGKAKAYNTYKDLKNVWAPNAQSWREQSATQSCIQLSLFLLALGSLVTLVIVNFWAEQKLTWAQTLLEPRLATVTVVESCQAPEDLIDYAALENGGMVLPENSSPSYHGTLLVRLRQETLGGFNKLDYLIERDNSRAHCWAFDGRQGHATIRLGRPVIPTQFALVHLNVFQI